MARKIFFGGSECGPQRLTIDVLSCIASVQGCCPSYKSVSGSIQVWCLSFRTFLFCFQECWLYSDRDANDKTSLIFWGFNNWAKEVPDCRVSCWSTFGLYPRGSWIPTAMPSVSLYGSLVNNEILIPLIAQWPIRTKQMTQVILIVLYCNLCLT